MRLKINPKKSQTHCVTLCLLPDKEGAFQATGAKYEGEYENDLKNGRGKYTYPNGDVYDGEWKDGKRHGKGMYRNKETGGV